MALRRRNEYVSGMSVPKSASAHKNPLSEPRLGTKKPVIVPGTRVNRPKFSRRRGKS